MGPFGLRINSFSRLWQPLTDVFEVEDKIIVRVEIPGMAESEMTLIFDNQLLTIEGFRPDTFDKRAFHQMEIHFGHFSTEISIPFPVEIDSIEATYEDGFLWVYLPKAHSKKIPITPKDE